MTESTFITSGNPEEGKSAVHFSWVPTDPKIRKGRLYVGSLAEACNVASLRRYKISLVITIAYPFWGTYQEDLYYRLGINHVTIPFLDAASQELDFREAGIKDIADELKKGGNVLVHCAKGISRSVSLCIAYKIVYERTRVNDALKQIAKFRWFVGPNAGFIGQLKELEEQELGPAAPGLGLSQHGGRMGGPLPIVPGAPASAFDPNASNPMIPMVPTVSQTMVQHSWAAAQQQRQAVVAVNPGGHPHMYGRPPQQGGGMTPMRSHHQMPSLHSQATLGPPSPPPSQQTSKGEMRASSVEGEESSPTKGGTIAAGFMSMLKSVTGQQQSTDAQPEQPPKSPQEQQQQQQPMVAQAQAQYAQQMQQAHAQLQQQQQQQQQQAYMQTQGGAYGYPQQRMAFGSFGGGPVRGPVRGGWGY
uniref:protein-tyrosine-phosphatase n=1 Tax=Chromera velia CCMP2878 TaxID=1169474 RepID=A0A0G4HPI1_9ALVE|eukprot:Cvel_29840.t1-p1 / transcript=Cvel_29840.t1 / gene=Cvel_29840 / organism=Chromera_velia_CCMP2878 / gene_product=Dual specificity protein phosphatase 1, putative / transcript_product=Dual specificity protein phosphatase 1, putative / location=Cvel_scaffold4159:1648-3364(+) / protein_length=416 / sequence_SO=supercontig / SO=protein_coding / is_pseudo=false